MGKLVVVICSFVGAWVLASFYLGTKNKVLYQFLTYNNGHFDITVAFVIAVVVGFIATGLSAKG